MLPFLKIAAVAAGGNVISEIAMRIFQGKESPAQAVSGVNWTRVLITAVIAVIGYFIVNNLLGRGAK